MSCFILDNLHFLRKWESYVKEALEAARMPISPFKFLLHFPSKNLESVSHLELVSYETGVITI